MIRLISSQKGLTIVEIIVVLVILSIVMTFLGSKLFGAGDRAKANLTKLQLKEIQSSIEQFRLMYNSLPNSLEELTRCSERTGPDCIPITNEDALYDAWRGKFRYYLENGGRSYKIQSLGSNGVEGGEGVDYDVFVVGP